MEFEIYDENEDTPGPSSRAKRREHRTRKKEKAQKEEANDAKFVQVRII